MGLPLQHKEVLQIVSVRGSKITVPFAFYFSVNSNRDKTMAYYYWLNITILNILLFSFQLKNDINRSMTLIWGLPTVCQFHHAVTLSTFFNNKIRQTIREVHGNAKLSYKLLRDINLVDIESVWVLALKMRPRWPSAVATAKCKANLSLITCKKQNSLLCSR